jgi:formylglycine-generating enzyme required for sulfatase activity
MKQNYKIYLCALLLVGAVSMITAGAQTKPKPKLAVLVVGMGSTAKADDFAARLGRDLNHNGEYELQTKDNNTKVASKLTELRAAHTDGTPADTTGLAAWGKQNSIDFVQLVVERGGTKVRFLTAQLLDCSTSQLVGRGTYRRTTVSRGMANPLPEMVQVYGGVFTMGCVSNRDGTCITGETPPHTVRVNNFSIGKYPITQAQWTAVMGSLPSKLTNAAYKGDDKPVIYVSYDDIMHPDTGFLAKLNKLTGRNYRLPTEAEWEYAARGCDAGACENFRFSGSNNNAEDVAWYDLNSGLKDLGPCPVGGKVPNRLGIYDMSGNVCEWCRDYYCATFYTTDSNPLDNPENTSSTCNSNRVLRGGGWTNSACGSGSWYSWDCGCYVVRRHYKSPSDRYSYSGFRVVLP